jgi:16S rRNA processing protein RimM
MKLEGVDDRNAAAGLVGQFLFVDSTHRVKVPHGRYFIHQVIGLAVVDDKGHPLGRVQEVLKLPGHDVYVIDHHGHEIMIPAVKEFIIRIDPMKGTMWVRLIEGMLEQ